MNATVPLGVVVSDAPVLHVKALLTKIFAEAVGVGVGKTEAAAKILLLEVAEFEKNAKETLNEIKPRPIIRNAIKK